MCVIVTQQHCLLVRTLLIHHYRQVLPTADWQGADRHKGASAGAALNN
jgi:hypothetical protein